MEAVHREDNNVHIYENAPIGKKHSSQSFVLIVKDRDNRPPQSPIGPISITTLG